MKEEQLEFDFTDGKKRDGEPKYSQSEMEKILDMGKMNAYGTMDKETFAEKVETMGIDEMRTLAIKVGVAPTTRQSEMRKRLLNNFDSYVSRHRATETFPTPAVDPKSKEYKNIEHLLGFD